VVDISSGPYHSVAAKSDGTAWAWGANTSGQLGDGSQINRLAPIQVPGLNGVTKVAAAGGFDGFNGIGHALALKSDGTVSAWGRNTDGQLGDGTLTQRLSPVAVTGLTGAIAIAASQFHSLALKSDGTVWAWGNNSVGQLGDGTLINRTAPVAVTGLAGVVASRPAPRIDGLKSVGLWVETPLPSWDGTPPPIAQHRCRCRARRYSSDRRG
jgi:alpha-tubulin suppressor-like RCC1 family protein